MHKNYRHLTEQEIQDLTDAESEEQFSYDMKYVNGGFSNSVDVTPGVGENTGKVFISINIFGGGEKRRVALPTSPGAKKLLAAYQIAIQKKDPSADKIKGEIEEYYKTLKNVVAKNFVPLMKELDAKTKQILIKSIQEVNK